MSHEAKASPGDAHSGEVLLDTAFRVFTERGYRATSLEEVAEAAGVTKGAIYYYFRSKEDLLRRALETRHRAIYTEIRDAVAAERAPAPAKVRLALRRIWQHLMEPEWGPAFRLVLGEMSVEFPELFRTWAEEGPFEGCRLVEELIEEGVRRGEFRADVDAEVSSRFAVCGLMLQSALHVHMGLDDIRPCAPERLFDSSVDLFLHGLSVTHRLAGAE